MVTGVQSKSLLTRVSDGLSRSVDALIAEQQSDGHWCYELEADCTIPAEYVLMMHFLDEIDEDLQERIATYLREWQNDDGGWPLYYGGKVDVSCTVKAYFALKFAGDDPEAPHMVRARDAVLARGGASRSNVFTRIMLAQFEQIPWRAVPFMPVEIVLFPRWFPFHLSKVSYWSRTVVVPLLILCSLRVTAKNPRGVQVRELFSVPFEEEQGYFPVRGLLSRVYLVLDRIGHALGDYIPDSLRQKAIAKAKTWFIERLNGEEGLGAIFPAMVNAHEALVALGHEYDDPHRTSARVALQKLLTERGQGTYCQPCFSPVWDTGLVCQALAEDGSDGTNESLSKAFAWLKKEQIFKPGDWSVQRPGVDGAGWAFQYANDYYPDLDDTAVVAWAMERSAERDTYRECIDRAANWLLSLQSANGGFAAFDADNTHYHLNEIPFADHGALLDPPTSDVTARVVTFLGVLGRERDRAALERAVQYLRDEQEQEGPWFGRWGTNYIYGTWSVLVAFDAAGVAHDDPAVQRAVAWLRRIQREDGGWGEHNDSYEPDSPAEKYYQHPQTSTSFQTAWALLGLLAAGEEGSEAVQRGIGFLCERQLDHGLWEDPWFTAPGFPRVFYLKYHGYARYFPVWALARYRNLVQKTCADVPAKACAAS